MDKSVQDQFRLSPLIRGTLVCVYLALVFPLPLMAPDHLQPLLWSAAPIGLALVLAMLSEQVSVDQSGIQVGHPDWCSWLLRRGWTLRWEDVKRLVPVGTSQGGTVYYIKTVGYDHRLLPQRLERFDQFLSILQEQTGLDTSSIGRLTPPWTYQLLFSLSLAMLAIEVAIAIALQMNWLVIPMGTPG